jgi:cytochrome c553
MHTILRSLLMLALAGPALANAQTEHQALDFSERLAACNVCHGAHGEGLAGSEYVPHLAGKPRDYLLQQLRAFRDGGRQHAQMAWLVRNLDDGYLGEISAHFAAMPPRTRAVLAEAPAATDPRAIELVQRGDPARGIAACTACHGDDLTGLEPAIPALVGLPADYVVAQFGAWRTGVRTAREPDCMGAIAEALEPAEIRALANWLATQGHADPRPPAAAGSFIPPQKCGGLPSAEVQP